MVEKGPGSKWDCYVISFGVCGPGLRFPPVRAQEVITRSLHGNPDNLPMLHVEAAQTLSLIVLTMAGRVKPDKTVACQSSDVNHSTGMSLFYSALCEWPLQEVSG
jgi:hypothetical protein